MVNQSVSYQNKQHKQHKKTIKGSWSLFEHLSKLNPKYVMLGLMLITAIFSMFMSYMATIAMMRSILTPIIAVFGVPFVVVIITLIWLLIGSLYKAEQTKVDPH
ncbi:hypothetical protein AK966_17975 [Vibrio sp. PID23_8]|nr:hypothetical protein AK966_17975 [Vibrio sp. PID23_8]